jgi:diketogulonate reductase-like aldo/keto reductase
MVLVRWLFIEVQSSARAVSTIATNTRDMKSEPAEQTMSVLQHSPQAFTRAARFGLGVYRASANGECYQAVLTALRAGYRYVDTAQIYRNEEDVGRAIVDSGVARDSIFITTKLWLSNWGYASAVAAVEESLTKLRVAQVDMFLLHAPGDAVTRADSWRALEDCRARGLIKFIGVSNFSDKHLEKLALTARVWPPAVNQIEVHPWLQRRELVTYCQSRGIVVEAYSPLAKAEKMSDPTLLRVAKRRDASAAQVLIAWSLAKGMVR